MLFFYLFHQNFHFFIKMYAFRIHGFVAVVRHLLKVTWKRFANLIPAAVDCEPLTWVLFAGGPCPNSHIAGNLIDLKHFFVLDVRKCKIARCQNLFKVCHGCSRFFKTFIAGVAPLKIVHVSRKRIIGW